MKRQKSFENELPTLYLVATPIGNLDEMTPRAIDILKMVDVIAVEDTRNTIKLLNHFDIKTKMIAHHQHNEKDSTKGLLQLLRDGLSIALVSDAGYPLVSDPGELLVKTITDEGFNVVPVSGSSPMLCALVASGLPVKPFTFIGFLDTQDKESKYQLECVKKLRHTLVFYEAPHRIMKTLNKMLTILGDRHVCLAREITKKHEEFLRGKISELLTINEPLKGEIVIIVEGDNSENKPDVTLYQIKEMIEHCIASGMSASMAIKEVSQKTGIAKNEIYRNYHQRS
ncbi:MAG: 16S rRNA (cytidine(1402)-2'-O)-methyltransferase [Erysipelotrichaceae bacterium]|nr:16S rRNA (cytidine(1402)-2'-O)-methyltransferase [Erysipelotrichaceae bacterium]MDD3923933.1 16S rRNA (cytidine(1402)-2'-O)-methyltransferase [Erysipelotrichaceae bacterium]MDD4642690.1 16S rRNA (cytidine(1402)-2'-O)-methyltransferase [Erysipelotrichaceae bacterium]